MFNRIADLPRNENGEIVILTEHLDTNNALAINQMRAFARTILEAGGCITPGTTTTSGATISVNQWAGINLDGTALTLNNQQLDLSSEPANTKLTVVAKPEGGETIAITFIDPDTQETLTHNLRVTIGRLGVHAGTQSALPDLPDDVVPVAHVTRSGSTLTVNEIVTDPPTVSSDLIPSNAWGEITGNIGDQTDLKNALDEKLEEVEWGDIDGDIAEQADLSAALSAKLDADQVGVAGGAASLDQNGRIPIGELPDLPGGVLEYANLAAFPDPGETGYLYLAIDTNLAYRWDTTAEEYVEIAPTIEPEEAPEPSSIPIRTNDGRLKTASAVDNDDATTLAQLDARILPPGGTNERPENPIIGQQMYDTDIGAPIWWNGERWIATGATDPLATEVLGIRWDGPDEGTFTRTGWAAGKNSSAGEGMTYAPNDFDSGPVFRGIHRVVVDGNIMVRVPKFYIRITADADLEHWEISESPIAGGQVHPLYYDPNTDTELPYVDVGASKGHIDDEGKLRSIPGVHPTVNENIVTFRTAAQAAGEGYQLADYKWWNAMQILLAVEHGTFHLQSVMNGFVAGRRSNDDVALSTEASTNRIEVANASSFEIGQSIAIGSDYNDDAVTSGHRVVTNVSGGYVHFDGDPVNITAGDVVANRAYRTGFAQQVVSSNGSPGSTSNGRFPAVWRGIESPWGDIYEFIDGVNATNVNGGEIWVCDDPEQYTSNVFAAPYEKVAYTPSASSNYIATLGYDPNHPAARLATDVAGSGSSPYKDYNHAVNGTARVLRGSGAWAFGAAAGPFIAALPHSSSTAYAYLGARLLKRP